MGTYTAQWEDEENNRILELSVRYILDGSEVKIESVTPANVTFIEAESRQPVRKLGVHTNAGRRFLLRLFDTHVGMDHLHRQVANAMLASA